MLKIVMTFVLINLIVPNNEIHVEAAEKESVTIAMRNNALNATIQFFNAQKNCKTDKMSKYSIDIQNVDRSS
ncbi:hypothetical protein [Metabacillus sp. Hm71]|uniref:hypothetical protein n=1 Tax=Metabacillus sp. Hm71 TaxID=3450743 RepID=UPI003F43291A